MRTSLRPLRRRLARWLRRLARWVEPKDVTSAVRVISQHLEGIPVITDRNIPRGKMLVVDKATLAKLTNKTE